MGEPRSSNINASELDEETKRKLKGDSIGNTLYSESFVIKTLMNLNQLKCLEEIEQDLCFLWDMTLEKDVCRYLCELQFPTLAITTLINYRETRYIELLIGILANILIVDCEKSLNELQVKVILDELNTDEFTILIQVMRFIEGLAYMMPEYVHLFRGEITDRLQFILKYSENFDLITHTMQALVRLTEDFKLNESEVNSDLFDAVVEGFDTIFSVETNNFEVEIDTEETSKKVRIFFNLIANMCAYTQMYPHDDVPSSINRSGRLAISICKIIIHLSDSKNLFPLSPYFNEYIFAFQTIITTRDVNVVQDIDNKFFKCVFSSMCKILYHLHGLKSEALESFNLVLEFIGNLINLVDENDVLAEFKYFRYRRGIVVLNYLKESSRIFEFDISDKLRFLFSKFK